MKLIHLSDLHIGKRVNEFSMLDDQEYIVRSVLGVIDDEAPDAILIAGDVYDKSIPSAEAVQLFDDFLFRLSQRRRPILIISGNHDSAERLAFGGRLMKLSGVYLSPVYDGEIAPVTLSDDYGPVHIYMLPFVKPVHVRTRFPDDADGIRSYTDAIRAAVAHMDVNPEERNVLITHQFVTGAARSDSEDISVGGADNVDADAFSPFDYVALGHLHGPQNVGASDALPVIRYCGSPLKYSFSEANQKKSVTVVELGAKGSVNVRTVALAPKRDMRELRGTYAELTLKRNYENTPTGDYLRITLTDEDDVPDAMQKLRLIYPNLMRLDYDNLRTKESGRLDVSDDMERRSPLEIFAAFYEARNNQPMSAEQSEYVRNLMEEIWEGAS